MAYVILFIFGCLLMLAGGAGLVREALKYKRMAAEYEESAAFWYDRWHGEVQDNVDLYNDLKMTRQMHSELAEKIFADRTAYQENLTALEIGTQEIEENYQQELLTEYDKVRDLKEFVAALEQIRVDHDVFCLPWLGCDFYPDSEDDDPPVFRTTVIQTGINYRS